MTAVSWSDPARADALLHWLASLDPALGLRPDTLRPASQDASTRRYLRLDAAPDRNLVLMDAPPASNDLRPFLQVGTQLREAGLHAPQVVASSTELGFMLLEDLGDTPYLQALLTAEPKEADRLMRAAIGALVQWQSRADASALPVYDEAFVRRELQIFVDWCVQKEYGREWTEQQQGWWEMSCQALIRNMLGQPFVAMHRDYMVRNLMVCDPLPGILDFQDMVRGPLCYDIASLLRDAFISWDEERELDWAIRYWEQARKAGVPIGDDFGEVWRRIEWCGLQRHLKILGIFCRLKHRDGKPHYAEDLPRLFAYAIKVSTRYIELSPLTHLLQDLRGDLVQDGFSLR